MRSAPFTGLPPGCEKSQIGRAARWTTCPLASRDAALLQYHQLTAQIGPGIPAMRQNGALRVASGCGLESDATLARSESPKLWSPATETSARHW